MERETIVAHVVTGARNCFETMLGMEIQPGQDYFDETPPPAAGGVVALIGLGGAHWMGTGLMSCSPEMACKIASVMMMADYPGISDDVLDAMAEMANMIFGYVKTEIEEELGGLCLSIPTVVFGRNFATRSAGKQPWSIIPATVGDEKIELRICLSRAENKMTSQVLSRSFGLS